MSGVRIWLVCVAFFYPLYWASSFALNALPGLVRAALPGNRLEYFQVAWWSATAVSAPPDAAGALRPGMQRFDSGAFLVVALVVLAALWLHRLFPKRSRLLTGLAVAMLGHVALGSWVWRLFVLKQTTPEVILASLLLFGVLMLGFSWMLGGVAPTGFWRRAASLLFLFPLPLAAMWGVFSAIVSFRVWSRNWWTVLPAILAALLVSLRPLSRVSSAAPPLGWKPVGLGIAATALLAAGIRQGGPALERARAAADRAAMAAAPEIPPDLPYPKIFFQKGVNFTSEWPNVYTSEGARRMLELLPDYGIDAIALVPYGFSSRDSPRIGFPGGMERDEGMEYLSKVAHHRGMKVLLKPQLWVRGGFPGVLEFSSAPERDQWFDQYRRFLEHYARLATRIHADMLCVGVELEKLSSHQDQWRKLIARTRELYPGPLVYAANAGPEFENLAFWDALDYIGLNNYYPLPDDLSTDAIVRKVEAVQQKFQRPVIFTEVGFSSYEAPHREPWSNRPGKLAIEEQARCYEAVFRAFYHKPWFQGMYWWRIGSSPQGGPLSGAHTPWAKPAMEVIARWYSSPR